jgi:hypothetical protein
MDNKLVFRVVLIIASGLALVCIVSHYCNNITPRQSANTEFFDTYSSPYSPTAVPMDIPDMKADKQFSSTGVTGAEEDMHDMPAPVLPSVKSPNASNASHTGVTMPSDLLPRLGNTPEEQKFAQLYSTGQGDTQGINFLDAGSQIGLSTRMNRNANLQLRSDPPIEKRPLPFMYSTIESDKLRLPLEIGSHSTASPAIFKDF